MLAVLIPVAIAALVVVLGVIVFQRSREGLDLSPQTLIRAYLYLGSFAGIVAIAFGVSALLNGAIASAVGSEVVYGFSPIPAVARPPCPPGQVCPEIPSVDEIRRQQQEQLERRRQEDLLRGATFAVFGALFYGAHRAGRGVIDPAGSGAPDRGGLRRAYVLVGTIVFGIGAIALLPAGTYQLLANVLVSTPTTFRPGVADTLSGGIVSLALWLLFLRGALREVGDAPAAGAAGAAGQT